MNFKDFEGFKRIKNTRDIDLDDLYEILDKYKKEIGNIELQDDIIIISINEKYFIEIRDNDTQIILERKSFNQENTVISEKQPDIELVTTNRMIEQIYDLINDYMDDGVIVEHITSAKKVLTMLENERKALSGIISLGNCFEVKHNNEIIYEVVQNKINQLYSVKNIQSKREVCVLKYNNLFQNEYTIQKPPFENITLKKDNTSLKTLFKGKYTPSKEIKILADYTDNHYLIEIGEIVIGAIDCLDPLTKKEYRLEINNTEYENMIIAIAVMLDIFELNKEQV